MPTGLRLRSACQYCHTRGRYQRMEVTLRWGGVVHLRYLTFCASCRSSWLELTFGKRGLQSGGLAELPIGDQVVTIPQDDGRMYPRRSRRFRSKVDLLRDAT